MVYAIIEYTFLGSNSAVLFGCNVNYCELSLMLNITLHEFNSAGIVYIHSDNIKINYVSGIIIKKCTSCFLYGFTSRQDKCPIPEKCYLSDTEVCNICQSVEDICLTCADGYYLDDTNCVKCPDILSNCAICSNIDTCTVC